jgi:hypothetical protein
MHESFSTDLESLILVPSIIPTRFIDYPNVRLRTLSTASFTKQREIRNWIQGVRNGEHSFHCTGGLTLRCPDCGDVLKIGKRFFTF